MRRLSSKSIRLDLQTGRCQRRLLPQPAAVLHAPRTPILREGETGNARPAEQGQGKVDPFDMHDIARLRTVVQNQDLFPYQNCTEIICWIHEPAHVLDYSTPHARSVAAMVRFRIASLSQRYLRRATLGGSGTTGIPMKNNSTTIQAQKSSCHFETGAARCRQGPSRKQGLSSIIRHHTIAAIAPQANRVDSLHRGLRRCCANISHNAPPYRVG